MLDSPAVLEGSRCAWAAGPLVAQSPDSRHHPNCSGDRTPEVRLGACRRFDISTANRPVQPGSSGDVTATVRKVQRRSDEQPGDP